MRQEKHASSSEGKHNSQAKDTSSKPTNVVEEQEMIVNEGNSAPESDNLTDELTRLNAVIAEKEDAYLRLRAEFENFKRRTMEEKRDLILNGGEKVLVSILPIADDIQRAADCVNETQEIDSLREGVHLIYNKLMSFLSSQGVKPIETEGADFDTDRFEAIATIPAPEEALKGKVHDCVQRGYTLNDKVIRHAKVVVSQ